MVCIATGHGLKDPNVVIDSYRENIVEIEPLYQEVEEALFAKC